MTERSVLGAALSGTDGTVTDFLEQLVGEPLEARWRRHTQAPAQTPNALDVAVGHPLLLRAALLEGRDSGTRYLYAETTLVPDRLSAAVRRRLEVSSDPIGRILDEAGVAMSRQPLARPERASGNGEVELGDCLWARRYRLYADGSPVMVIAEWFLPSLEAFLGSG